MIAHLGAARLQLVQGDITVQQVDAIVNAANAQLAGGGGVDGAIHRAAGPAVMQETDQRYPDGCPTGSAVVSGGGQLAARYIFHAVGPVWRGGHHGEAGLLESAIRRCLELAVEHDCQSLALPALSTGVYGYPMDLAARTTLETIVTFLMAEQRPQQVMMVLFDEGAFGAFACQLERLLDRTSPS